MANNINTNLASRLFAYIEHKVDISQNLKDVYKSSIIFIGDEQQILVPQFNAYVGIGMTSYNNTISRISDVENDIAALKKELGSNSVKGINVQWGKSDSSNKINEFETTTFKYNSRLSGNITIVGDNDYNENTGFAYRGIQFAYIGNRYTGEGINQNFGKWYSYRAATENSPAIATIGDGWTENTQLPYINASSGITLTYFYETEQTTENGVVVTKPINNRIVIDDKKTWTYMTNAYAYSLEFTRDYTNMQVETLYHDLLGIGEQILIPVTNDSMWRIDPTNGDSVFIGGTFYEWNDASTPVMPISMNDSDNPVKWTFPAESLPANYEENPTGLLWAKITAGNINVYNAEHEHFKVSTDYNSTYNMNIANGIQTLKEVAYILDQLSDGSLGTVTYITRQQWEDNSYGSDRTQDVIYFVYGEDKTYTGTLYRVTTASGEMTTNSAKYAYFVNTANPENLGIQMAYSIAGNTADIQDLHEHVEYAEKGFTTLRSIAYYNIPNSLITMYQYSNVDELTKTDTNQTLPNQTYAPTYSFGDTRMYTRLDLAVTYYTYNNAFSEHNDSATRQSITTDAEWKGMYKKADPTEICGLDYSNNHSGVTYYHIVNDQFVEIHRDNDGYYSRIDWPESLDAVFNTQNVWSIWYIPGNTDDTAYSYANYIFKSVDNTFVANNINTVRFYTQNNGKYTYVETPTVKENNSYYIVEGEGAGFDEPYARSYDFAQHAIIDGSNKIATTVWVSAYMKDAQHSLEAKIDNVLAAAKDYTNEQINSLDNNYKYSYSDFYTYWYQNGGNDFYDPNAAEPNLLHAPNTIAYINKVGIEYGIWINWLSDLGYYRNATHIDEQNGLNVVSEYVSSSYTVNRMRSEVISNVYEINGITYAESRELPTDDIVIRTDVWNDQRNNNNTMSNVELALDGMYNGNNIANEKVEKLFAFVANVDANTGLSNPMQIYAKYPVDIGDNNETLYQKTYVKTPEPETIITGNTITDWTSSYWTLNNDGTFITATKAQLRAFFLKATDSFEWKQLYHQEDAYYEIIIDSIEEIDEVENDVIATANILVPGSNGTTEESIDITCTDSGATNLYIIEENEANRTNYMSAFVKHYDYTQKGGQGQNRFNLQLNVTHIEDATIDNTGLADAFDVQNYIANMFTWVNISASVTEEQLENRAGFYTQYSTVVNGDENSTAPTDSAALIVGKTLYHFTTVDGVDKYAMVVDNGTPIASYTITHLAKDISNNIVAFDSQSAVNESDFYALGYGGSHMVITYTRTQEVYTNPLNMTLTQVQ